MAHSYEDFIRDVNKRRNLFTSSDTKSTNDVGFDQFKSDVEKRRFETDFGSWVQRRNNYLTGRDNKVGTEQSLEEEENRLKNLYQLNFDKWGYGDDTSITDEFAKFDSYIATERYNSFVGSMKSYVDNVNTFQKNARERFSGPSLKDATRLNKQTEQPSKASKVFMPEAEFYVTESGEVANRQNEHKAKEIEKTIAGVPNTYVAPYRSGSDASEYLTQVQGDRDELDKSRQNLKALYSKYAKEWKKMGLTDEAIKNIEGILSDDSTVSYDNIVKAAESDSEFWSRFNSEEEYKSKMAVVNGYKIYTGKTDFEENSREFTQDELDELFNSEYVPEANPDELYVSDVSGKVSALYGTDQGAYSWDANQLLSFLQDPRRLTALELVAAENAGEKDSKEYSEKLNKVFGSEDAFSDYMKTHSENPLFYVNQQEAAIARYIYRTKDEDSMKAYLDSVCSDRFPDDRTWFQGGAFSDGYDFGDVTRVILGTGTDIVSDVATGAMGILEETIDTGAYFVGGAADLFGADDFADDVSNFIGKDIIPEEKVANVVTNVAGFGTLNKVINGDWDSMLDLTDGTATESNSILGDKSDALVQSGGQLAGTIGLQFAGIPWWVTSGVTSFGSQAEHAFREGASYLEAGASGLIAAGAELLTEKLFGGSGLGEKGLINTEALTKTISNKTIKLLADYGIDVLGEGIEEVASSVFQRLGTALYKEENLKDILLSEEAFDEYLESFIGGMVLGGVMNVGKGINSYKTGRDYHTGLTANEQAVVDKVYEDALKVKEADGKILTSKEKKQLKADIIENMKHGQLDINDIESVLGGEEYKAYREYADSDDALKTELSDLQGMEYGKMNDLQHTRLNELKGMNLDDTTKRDGLRKKLNDKVFPQLKDSYLAESYNEIAKKGQAFKADLTKYKGKQRKAVERAVKSGVLNDTYHSHVLVDTLSKIEADKGIVFDYTDNQKLRESGFALEGKTVNGYVDKSTGAVNLNVQSAKSWQSVVGHEITHVLEGTDAYSALRDSLYTFAESRGELESRREALTKLYKDIDADIEAELTADLVGDYLFTNKDFITHLTTNRNLFKKFYDEIKYLRKVATGKQLTEIEKVKREFDKAWKELSAKPAESGQKNNTTESGVRYSLIGKDIDGIEVYETSEGNLKKIKDSQLGPQISHESESRRPQVNESTRLSESFDANISHPEETVKKNSYADEFVAEYMKAVESGDTETAHEDIRFSLSEPVEETKDLVAIHNLQSSELAKTIELGGFPMPSIAVIKAQQSHDNYGDVSVIFPKDTIDPEANKSNKVYGGDAWTPTYPRIEYKVNDAVDKRIRNKYYELYDKLGYDAVRPMYRYANELEDSLNRDGGEDAMLEKLYDDAKMMQIYLEDTGKGKVEPVVKETRTEMSEADVEMNQWFVDNLGVDFLQELMVSKDRKKFISDNIEEIENAYKGLLSEKYGFNSEDVQSVLDNTKNLNYMRFLRDAYNYHQNGTVTVKTETDYAATDTAIREKSADGYKAWIDNLFKGVQEKTGIYNNQDYFTANGNRRSWDALHWENTLENVVRAMKGQEQTGADAFAPSSALFAVANTQYGSIAEIKEDSHRLGRVTEDEYEALKDSYTQRLAEISNSIKDTAEHNLFIATEHAAELIVDAVRQYKTKSGMLRYMQKWNNRVTAETVDDIFTLVSDIASMPTSYFEAKPQRAVGLEEVGVFVIPRNADAKLKQELLNRGYSIAEYDPNIEGDRQRVVNQFEEYKFSLSNEVEDIAPTGNYSTPLNSLYYGEDADTVDDIGPVKDMRGAETSVSDTEDIAPVVAENAITEAPIREDIAPVAEQEAERELQEEKEDSYSETPLEAVQTELENLRKFREDAFAKYEQKIADKQAKLESKKNKDTKAANNLRMQIERLKRLRDTTYADYTNIIDPLETREKLMRERLAREQFARESKPLTIQTVEQKVAENIRAVEVELADNIELRKEAEANYSEQIAILQKQLNEIKNVNTKKAYDLLQSISRLERLKASADAKFAKRISDLEARAEKMKDPTYSRALHRQAKMQEHAKWAEELLGDTSTWADKKLGLQYSTNTERRNLRDIVRDENGNRDIARADAIDEALNGRYNREEAAKKREHAQVTKKYADLKITKAESAYIQMLGELRYNPKTSLTKQVVNEYYERHKNKINKDKVDKVIVFARNDFDSLLKRLNERLREQGMRKIPYRKGYFPHFTEPKQNFIQKLLNWKTHNNEIPTSIAGLTEDFRPVKSWQSFDKQRYTDDTDYNFLKGFDNYLNGALDWIYHIDTLQKRRAVENHIRFTHSDNGIQARIKEVYANEELDADETQAQIEHILTESKNPLSNFLQDFTTHTNILAGKKNSLDRTVEQMTSRKIYSVMTNVQNRSSANMVLANVRSALSNFIPIPQSWVQVSPLQSLRAAKETIANAIKDDGKIAKSTFLTNRLKEPDKLYKTNWDKVYDKAGIMFNIIDNITSQIVWRSKYNQNIARKMSESEAIKNADQFAENVMAGRSKGNEPTLFNAKNPLVKVFTMFQLEVNNQYGYLFKDAPNDLKAETKHWKFNLAKGYTTAFVGAYVYNALMEQISGSGAALDPIGIIEELLRDLGLFDDDEEKEPDEVVINLLDNVVEELPFVGGLFGGGRVPISSAMPYGDEYDDGVKGFIKDVSDGNWKNIGKEMMNPILNVGLPVGGGQLKKTYQGLKMFNTDEEHPVAGSYTDSGNLRFPVEDTPINRIQAGLFGQYANENAREYFDNDYAPLNEKQIQEYMDVGLPISDYWKYREGLKGLKTNAEKADYINSLDIDVQQKNLLLDNILDRKEDVDMSDYNNFSDWEEFDYAQKNPEKYAVSKAITNDFVSYRKYTSDLSDIKADKDENGKSISGSRKDKVIDYINNLDIDYGAKLILIKTEYPSDDSYNEDILDYLNEREDITYEEATTILKELGFKVVGDNVYWD